ncbi:MAG: TonB-dependent receptor [Candidatus Omnitrophica bacterium]|nr:TonB-dependent receptor [Candidatus Omnitrophota bacterium]
MERKKILAYLLTICKTLVYIVAILHSFSGTAFSEESIRLEPVVVTAKKQDEKNVDFQVSSDRKDSITVDGKEAASNFSVSELLKKFSLADVRTRGPYGVQSDISLRGAPFEENLVLLYGIGLNDPKSGHHNMDLPLTLYDTEKIDVEYGSLSAIYGSGAIGGAINIIPRQPQDKLGFFVSSATGPWDFYTGAASLNIPAGPLKNRTSVEWKRSTGFAPETEFDTLIASSHSVAEFGNTKFETFLGYLTKKFGASNFYSDLYPNEEESINTGLLITKAEIKEEGVSILPVFYWKRLQDKFILDRNRRDFYRNDHTTNIYGGEIKSRVETSIGNVSFGVVVGNEDISSTSLGSHYRIKNGSFLGYESRFGNLLLDARCRLDYYSTFGLQFSPSLRLGYEITPNFFLKGGAGRAFRVPTFTELYYSSPANIGNPDLKPETGWTYDTGLSYKTRGMILSGTIFLRNTEGVIDWTRRAPQDAWRTENIGDFDIYGIETSFTFEFEEFIKSAPLKSIALKYAYLESTDKKGITSKYVLEYLKHNLTALLKCELPFGFTQEINFSFRKRIGSKRYFLLDSTIYKDVGLKKGKMTCFVKLSNIFDTRYKEQGEVEMPGFAVFGGGSVKF